ncbi:MAG TPA: hypothetical protein VGM67_13670 [Gemmatimonadaceae bacterium]|jgi:hypothetical protein
MKAALHETREAGKGSIVISLAAHVVLIALIASITFRYPLSAFFKEKTPLRESIQYVQVQPKPAQTAGNGIAAKANKKKVEKPAPQIVAPTSVPTELPPTAPPTSMAGADSGTGIGNGTGAAVGIAAGLSPSLPDPRIELRPNTLRIPLSNAERNDSAVKAIIGAYREAEIAAAESRGRSPRDWTIERNGGKYGLDSQYIYLGKFKLPSAILAALPLNRGGVDGTRIRENREADFIRDDIYSHAQGMSEEDFNAAIKRIRERKDREIKETKEADDAKKAAAGKPTPIVP